MEQTQRVGFLLIHGLAGSHNVLLPLAEFLEEKNLIVRNIDLPGHNTTPEDLKTRVWAEWTEYAQEQLEQLKDTCDQVYLSGTSLGGIISLFLAARNEGISGIILFSTALKPFNLKSWVVYNFPFIRYFIRWVPMKNFVLKYIGIPTNWWIYEKIPMESLSEGVKLLKSLEIIVNKVVQPILIIHSHQDKLIPFKTTKQITSAINSEDVTIAGITEGGHVILKDKGCNHSLEIIDKWLEARI